VRQATIVSPFTGTVAAVNLSQGEDVDAESDTAAIVVVGSGGYEVTTFVSVDDLEGLALGQPATVAPDGSHSSLDGEVVRIGVVADDGSYPVTVGLHRRARHVDLGNGSTASVQITTAASDRALAVPTSAVSVDGDRHTVTVLDGGSTKVVRVAVGAVGDPWTEIKSGLHEGDEVVLADVNKPLPGSATDTSSQSGNGRFANGGGFFVGRGGGPPNFSGGGG
jgi:multidrug efflux pump subunit AcrA (membrane-fusion protein)